MNIKWMNINWAEVNASVLKIQREIAIAWECGDKERAIKLQERFVRTFAARAKAVQTVCTNSGKNTPGVDGVIFDSPELKMQAVVKLYNLKNYKAEPVRRVFIDKADGSKRPLGIPTMFDRCVQSLFYISLLPYGEMNSSGYSFGFRPFRSCHDAISLIFLLMANPKVNYDYIFEGDIEKCYDKISHKWLLENVPIRKDILEQFLKAGFIDIGQIHETLEGVPQGGVISPLLANLALNGIERLIPSEMGRLIRYADDFVILCKCKDFIVDNIRPDLEKFLEERGLRLKESKTFIKDKLDPRGIIFLGFHFKFYLDKGKNKYIFLIIPPKEKIIKFREKLKSLIKGNPNLKAIDLIRILNPVLRGWANYYRSVVSTRVFSAMDWYIWKLLYLWVRHKHRNVSLRKVVILYFKTVKGIKWTFYGNIDSINIATLYKLAYTNIKRHRMIPLSFNYFLASDEELKLLRIRNNPNLNLNQTKLWGKQKGICPVCMNVLSQKDDLEVHHTVARKNKGRNTLNNLILIHAFCHNQVTFSKSKHLRAVWESKGIIRN